MASHFRTLPIKDIRRETSDCVSISFAIPAELRDEFLYKQGQNITIRKRIGEEEIRRSYSICSSPHENELRIAVKKVPGGRFSLFANEQLHKGEELEILPPTGRFYTELEPTRAKNYLAFAAGSGITPVISIIKATLATEPGSQFTLVYGNRNRTSIIFREELEALKDRYMDRFALHHILSREKTDATLNYGRIDAEKCGELTRKLIGLQQADEVFICGPAEMIFGVKSWLEKEGIAPEKIHFELFSTPVATGGEGLGSGSGKSGPGGSRARSTGAGSKSGEAGDSREGPDALAGKTSKVTIRLDGFSFDFDLPFDGEPILDAALREGADLPFACKGGVCCTCRARLTEGKVEMEVNYALEKEELAAGFILTCQSHPRTERVIVDFDTK
ncbi:MAG TPA: 2Fe-2S iron-sulfur cluster-binding protein [Puia sp.]|nr:2Fe-2S iron-sulfur cluster-binding protein [Puia sp.]